VSLLLENEFHGEVYQFNIPAKSLFGKGDKNVHPFESYIKYVISNNESPDRVVTKIAFDPDADTMELNFSAERILSQDEFEVVKAAQQRPETERYTKITVAQTDGVKKAPVSIEKPKVVRAEEPEDEVIAEPVKKENKKAAAKPKAKDDLAEVLDAWGSDD
jgi:esterase/lipase superfamily enzyme